MKRNLSSIAKITAPRIAGTVPRERLHKLLDRGAQKPVVWITAPAGSGKTTLVASWLESRKLTHIWYKLDAGDSDPATFFHYLGLATDEIKPGKKNPLPHLTPEYLMDVPTFTRRYFEALSLRFAKRGTQKAAKENLQWVLVIDNYQEVVADSVLHELLVQGIEALPQGAAAIVISRGEPASQFTRLRANGRMAVVGWNELRFTLDEVKDAVKPWRREHCLERDCPGPETLFEKTDGWAAGLRLMIEAVEPQRKIVRSTPPGESVCHCVESLAWKDDVFGFFGSEVMTQTDPAIRDFLIATSFLPVLTSSIAEKLTGRQDAGAILRDLSRRNFFTDWHPGPIPVYQYHFLFREFLQTEARNRYSGEDRVRIRRTGAELLEAAGFIEEAAGLFCQAGDYARAVPLIARISWPMLAQGRLGTIERLLAQLPREIVEADPGLLHVAGLDRLTSNLAEARQLLEKAFQHYLEKESYAAAVRVGGSVLETIIIEGSSYEAVDLWIDRLDAIVKKHRRQLNGAEVEAAGIVLFALAYRNLNHPSLSFWLETAEASVLKFTDTAQVLKLCNYLMAYYLFSGEYGSMSRLMKVLKPFKKDAEAVPTLHLLSLLLEAYYTEYALGDVQEGIELARRGLALGRQTGIAIYGFWFSYMIVAASVVTGDLPTAEECLATITAGAKGGPPVRRGDIFTLSGGVAMGRKAWSEAAGHFQQAVDVVQQAGVTYSATFYRVLLAQALFELGQEEKARRELAAAAREKWAHSEKIRCHGLLTQGYFDLRQGNREQARAALREGFKAAKTGCIMTAPFWKPETSSLVCAEALEAGIEPEFVRELIEKHRLSPPSGQAAPSDGWPWPVKIHTLGCFEIMLDGHSQKGDGKLPKKPLEALKALIALGGRDVPEERIMDALWPEAEGDAARVSLKIALHQLRQGLGDKQYIALKNGRLSLSPDHCWVDALAFQQAWDSVQAGIADRPNRLETARRAIDSYRGPFLPGDEARTWSTAMRERLKNRFVRLVLQSAGELMNEGLLSEAAEQYENAQDVEELDEDLCRKLMTCWARMGRKDKVEKAFRRCEVALRSRLGVELTEETCKLYDELIPRPSRLKR